MRALANQATAHRCRRALSTPHVCLTMTRRCQTTRSIRSRSSSSSASSKCVPLKAHARKKDLYPETHCPASLALPPTRWQAGSSLTFTIIQPFTYKHLAINADSWLAPLRRVSLLWFHLPLPTTFAVCWLTLFTLGVAAPLRNTHYSTAAVWGHRSPDDPGRSTGIFWKSVETAPEPHWDPLTGKKIAPPSPPPVSSQLRTATLVSGWEGAVQATHANATLKNATARPRANTSQADAPRAAGSRPRRLTRLSARQQSLL